MVQSLLNPEQTYDEVDDLNDNDIDYDAQVWSYELFGTEFLIAIGNKKTISNIDIFPIYLIKDDRVISKVGLFEMVDSNKYMDSDGDLDINQLSDPLLFSFVDKNYLEDKTNLLESDDVENSSTKDDSTKEDSTKEDSTKDDSTKDDSKKDQTSLEGDTLFIETPKTKQKDLPEQTREMADNERETIVNADAPWISKYLENDNFDIVDVNPNGDCYFIVLHLALKSIGKNISVEKMRGILSNEATEDLFKEYYTLYTNISSELDRLKTKIKTIQSEHKEFSLQFKKSVDRSEQIKLRDQAKEKEGEYKELLHQKRDQKDLLMEYEFMQGIDSLDKFKEVILTRNYWADTWAITTLERILNIKSILFDEQCYEDTRCDNINVIQCGQLNDNILKDKGEFKPDYYVLMEYAGNHYKLITFKNKSIFKFSELMYTIRHKIVESCLQNDMGSFGLIKDFVKLKKSLQIEEPEVEKTMIDNDLYNEAIVFRINYKLPQVRSRPGSGKGEEIPLENKGDFAELQSMKKWRVILDNMNKSEFECDKKRWLTLEHYIQGNKFKLQNEIYNEFSLDSNSELSQDPELAYSYGMNTLYKGKRVRPKNIKPDSEYNEYNVNISGLECKLNQNEEFKNTLIKTKDAKLMQNINRKPPRTQIELMNLRKKLM